MLKTRIKNKFQKIEKIYGQVKYQKAFNFRNKSCYYNKSKIFTLFKQQHFAYFY